METTTDTARNWAPRRFYADVVPTTLVDTDGRFYADEDVEAYCTEHPCAVSIDADTLCSAPGGFYAVEQPREPGDEPFVICPGCLPAAITDGLVVWPLLLGTDPFTR